MKALKCFLVTVFFALLVNSCNNPFNVLNTSEAGKLPAGKGSLYLKIAEAGNERTIMPSALANENFIYELIVTSIPDGKKETIKPAALETPVILDVGVYSLVVNAYANEDQQLLFSGTADIEITEGENSATVNLQPVIGDGTGTFSWDITFPDDVSSAVMEIAPRGGGTTVEIPLYDERTGVRNLPSGFYDVTIYMTGNNPDYGKITVTRKEILHVYNGRVSEYENSFADVRFVVYNVTFQYTAGIAETKKVTHGDTISGYVSEDNLASSKPASNADAYLYKDAVPAEPGYTFAGWYLNQAFTEKWADDTPVTSVLTLYPKWLDDSVNVSGSNTSAFANIVDYINDSTDLAGIYTMIIADEVFLEESLTIKSGVTLTVTSADNTASTINRGFGDDDSEIGLFIVEDGACLTFEKITIDGQKDDPQFSANATSLVRVNGGTFTMNDGAVLKNNQASDGVAVLVEGTFIMSGGTISGNEVVQTSTCGGAVLVNGTFIMSGGTIGGEEAESGNTAIYGGGVYVNSNATFNMTGGTITGNSAANGGGVFSEGTLILGGEAVIKGNKNGNDNNNVYLYNSSTFITLSTPPLQSPAEIWVQTATSSGVIVNEGATNSDVQYFHADDEANSFIIFDNGKLVIKTATPEKLTFTPIEGNTAYSVKAINNSITGEVIIPASYNGKPVTEIGDLTDDENGAFLSTSITAVYIPATVTLIGGSAFSNCYQLTSITIPASVTTIGDYAFLRCSDLSGITVDAGNLNYLSENGILYNKAKTILIQAPCTISGSVTIPATVTSIGINAFYRCFSLESVTFAANSLLTSIGMEAFASCFSLTDITIPAGVTSIGDSAFSYTGITSITIPEGVTSIGNSTFSNCNSLASIIIPVGVTSIGGDAFAYASITSITLPAGLTEIGDGAFYECIGLTSITIPASVSTIEGGAFSGCINLAGITVEEANAYYLSEDDVVYNKTQTVIVVSPGGKTVVTIPASVTEIGRSAFQNTKLATITFAEDSLLEIINDQAFVNCTNLASITLPAGITNINYAAFSGCSSLATVTCLAVVPPMLSGSSFQGTPSSLQIKVPSASVSVYQNQNTANNWYNYASKISAIED